MKFLQYSCLNHSVKLARMEETQRLIDWLISKLLPIFEVSSLASSAALSQASPTRGILRRWFLHRILGSLLCVLRSRCKKLGHAALTVWPVVVPRVYPAVCCSYALFSFSGSPPQVLHVVLETCVSNHIHWVSRFSTQGVQKVQIQRSAPLGETTLLHLLQ